MNVARLLAGPLRERPGAAALIEGSGAATRVTTFAELDLLSRRHAALLHAGGVGPGDAVLFFEAPGVALYASLIAVFRLGAVAAFVELSAGRGILDSACAMWAPRALVAMPKAHLLRAVSPALRRIPLKLVTRGWAPGARRLASADAMLPHDDIAARAVDDPALLTFTSGSTGEPKGAVRSHGVLRAQLDALGSSVAAGEGERELVSLPIVVLLNLARGVTTVLPDADLRKPGAIDPRPVRRQIMEHGATRATVSPAFLERLTEGDARLGTLRTIVTGGGPVFPDIVARARAAAPAARLVSVYGSTEAEPIAHVKDDDVSEGDLAAMRAGAGLLAGHPDPCVSLRILRAEWGTPIPPLDADELEARVVPPGAAGEIVVAGAHVVPGYLHGRGDAETKFRVSGRVWHRTGDLGRLDEHGRLWLLGRASAAIADSRGELYPFAVECAARSLLHGRRVAALGLDGARVLAVEGVLDPSALDSLCRELAWARLDTIRSVPRMPLDRRHNSKVDYPGLVRMLKG